MMNALTVTTSALLFDMDGVLIDSMPAVERVWRAWAAEHGFDPDEVAARAHGRPSLTTVREYLPNADHDLENREIERRELADVDGIAPLPGAIELLRSLPVERWAIVTSCTLPLARARARAGGLPEPRLFITADDVKQGKPGPEPYQTAARGLGISPAQCIVVEDVDAGVASGKAAGARVIALATSLNPAKLRRAGADWVVANCAALGAALIDGELQITLAQPMEF
ncbi:MAG TPA: HAD family hydrolase [Terriglobales bacterium]|nr:HAD family hydrolase [Terriglobales bacterium]